MRRMIRRMKVTHLATGSLKIYFLEQPLHHIFFGTKLAKLKILYDAACDVAVQKASEIERMRSEVFVNIPIVVFLLVLPGFLIL
jgi:vacuolar protein sorting-associated protein 13A/C